MTDNAGMAGWDALVEEVGPSQAGAIKGKEEGTYEKEGSSGKAASASKSASAKSGHANKSQTSGAHKEAAKAHKSAAEAHEKAGNKEKAGHHKAMASKHASARTGERVSNNMTRNLKRLIANCTCAETRRTLIAMNAKLQGSNEDTTGDDDFDAALMAGGNDDGSEAEDDSDESEADAEKKPPKIGTGDVTGNRRMTRQQWLAVAPPEVVEEHRLVQNVLHRQKVNVVRQLVGHLPPEQQKKIVTNMRLMNKSLEELQQLLILQRPVVNHDSFDDVQPNFIGQTMPTINGEQVVNSTDDDVVCMVPPVMNFKKWVEEDRAKERGGKEGGGEHTSAAAAM